MPDLQNVMEKTKAITTKEEIWDKVEREYLESIYDFYSHVAVDIREILKQQELDEETEEILTEMKDIISSMGEIPKTFDPDSDVEAFRQEVVRLQDRAERILRD